ncbi:flagellar hook-basal body complex protein FliE [Palleronia sediminis]|uniref:Flagellar hook-basal body complex protein FliE n=1 Tax=Palleronia sediminis TaxID=2547833 RepID=A0A4R5ZVS2_9RHOB|nr:flagellar hook-basal body complex protein FliE [Palleronia sediminis]TDL74212.1 flagellar hook-basal body complex protein FliE [Palleronia sediminis]
MDITSARAAQLFAAARPATAPSPEAAAGKAGDSFAAHLAKAETVARDAMTGAADPHALVSALSQAKFAVEAAVTVRDKVVEAYQEILRMPV